MKMAAIYVGQGPEKIPMTTYLPPNVKRNVKYVLLLTNSDWQQNQSQIERNVEWISLSTIKSKLDSIF